MAAMYLMWRRPRFGRKVFFIGFNKCGTKSLHGLFAGNGYRALHGRLKLLSGRKINLAQAMSENLRQGSPITAGFERYDVFSDMVSVSDRRVIEACLMFREMHAAHPDAYFVLNTRPVEDWLRSRLNHANDSIGSFIDRQMRATGLDQQQVVEAWRTTFEEHHAAVRAYFAGNRRFLEFSIYDDVAPVVELVREDYTLNPGHWRHLGRTSERKSNRQAVTAAR